MVFNGKIGIRLSYLIMCFGYKANKCSCFTSKKWQEGVANFGNGDIISALVRPPTRKSGWVNRRKKYRGAERENTVGKWYGAEKER